MARAMLTGRVQYLILHVTSACNARCRMCFNWEGMRARHSGGIALSDVERLASSMTLLPQLTCSGGEPLLHDGLSRILEAFYHNARTRFFTVPTNCLMPNRVAELIDAFTRNCPDAFLNMCLPFHGTGEDFDNILGVRGAFEAFNETYAIVCEAKKRSANISCLLNFVMSKFNAPLYRDIIDAALDHYPEAPLGIAYARGETKERDAVEVPLATFRDAHSYLASRRKNQSRFNPYTIMFSAIGKQMGDTVATIGEGTTRNLHCRAGRRFLVVYENGMVYPCELLDVVGIPDAHAPDAPKDASLGDLKDYDYDLQRLLQSEHAQHVMQWIDSRGCVCTWECAVYSRLVHSPVEMMRLGANAIRYILKPRA